MNFASEMNWKYKIISEGKILLGLLMKQFLVLILWVVMILCVMKVGFIVQRIPETETKGRVHTSTAAVVVLPKLSEGMNLH